MIKHNKSGYILVLTLLLISMSMFLITSILQNVYSYQRNARTTVSREKLRTLALGSLQISIDQLSFIPPKKTKDLNKLRTDWQKKIIKLCGTGWQKTINFSDDDSRITATIDLFYACGQGKFNLSFDNVFGKVLAGIEPQKSQPSSKNLKEQESAKTDKDEKEKKEGQDNQGKAQEKNPIAKFIDELINKETKISIAPLLKKFREEFNRVPEDPSELMKVGLSGVLKDNIFPVKQAAKPGQDKSAQDKANIYLMDLFTVDQQYTGKLNPWALSKSTAKLLGFRPNFDEKSLDQFNKDFKPNANWATDWDKILAPIYGKKYAAIDKKVFDLFESNFTVSTISVLSQVTIGQTTQKVYAILKATAGSATAGSTELPKDSVIFKIIKLYWL